MKVRKTLKDNKKKFNNNRNSMGCFSNNPCFAIAYSIVESVNNGIFDFSIFIQQIFSNITSFNTFGKVFGEKYIGAFFKTLAYYTIIYIVFSTIGLFNQKLKVIIRTLNMAQVTGVKVERNIKY